MVLFFRLSEYTARMRLHPFLVLLLAFTGTVTAQTPIEGQCQAYSGTPESLCYSVAPTIVYIPPGEEQALMQTQVSRQLELYVSGIVTKECAADAIRWFCGQMFAPCVMAQGKPTPIIPCVQRCEIFENSCRAFHDLTNTAIVCPQSNVNTIVGQCNNVPIRNAVPTPTPQGTCRTLTILDTPRSHCSEIINYQAFIPDGVSLRLLDDTASLYNYLAVLNQVSHQCADAMMEFACAQVYPRCQEQEIPELAPAVLSSPTCYMACYNYNRQCAQELNQLVEDGTITPTQALLPLCEEAVQVSSSVYTPMFPPQVRTVRFPQFTVDIPCTQPSVHGHYQAPRCERFQGFPQECASLDLDWVWIEAGTTQEQLAAEARVRLAGIQAAPTSCRRRALRVVCASVFRACESHTTDQGLVLYTGRPVCAGFCEETLQYCAHHQGFDMELFTCDSTDSSGDYQLLPTAPAIIPGWPVDTPCFIPNYRGDYPELKECPYPYSRTNDEEDVCDYTCPSPVYSEGQYRARLIVSTILGYIGTGLGFFTAISFALHPLKRTFPRNLVAYQVLAAAFLSLSFLIPHWVMDAGEPVFRDAYCENAWTEAEGRTNAACGAQSFFDYCFHLSVTLWYVVVAAFLVKAVFSINIPHRAMLPLQALLHAICWGAPIIVWICLISTGHISSSGKDSCFVSPDWWHERAHEVFFYYPLIIMMALGMLLVAVAFIGILKKTGKMGMKRQFRVILYLLYTFAANLWVIFEHFFEIGYTSRWSDAIGEWRECSLISLTPCNLAGSYPFGMDLTTDIVISSKAIFLSLILLQDTEIWVLWGLLIKKHLFRQEVDIRETLDQRDAVRRLHKKMNTSSQKSSSDNNPENNSDWGADDQ